MFLKLKFIQLIFIFLILLDITSTYILLIIKAIVVIIEFVIIFQITRNSSFDWILLMK